MNLQDRIQDMVNEIQNELGYGHTKDVYKTALKVALQDGNLIHETDKVIPIAFRNRFVGSLIADIVVDQRLVLMMCGDRNELINQCTMYKSISQLPHGLVILFTPHGPILELC